LETNYSNSRLKLFLNLFIFRSRISSENDKEIVRMALRKKLQEPKRPNTTTGKKSRRKMLKKIKKNTQMQNVVNKAHRLKNKARQLKRDKVTNDNVDIMATSSNGAPESQNHGAESDMQLDSNTRHSSKQTNPEKKDTKQAKQRIKKLKKSKSMVTSVQTDLVNEDTSDNEGTEHKIVKHVGRNVVYECKYCRQKIYGKNKLIQHIRLHDFEYQCPSCEQVLQSDAEIDEHLRVDHFWCKGCNIVFPNQLYVDLHTRQYHSEERPFQCSYCLLTFKWHDELQLHNRKHLLEFETSEDWMIKCRICNKDFSRKEHLATHMRIHNNIKPFKCEICPAEFADRANLVTHKRIHTGEKPYQCELCPRRFNNSGSLVSHRRQHTGERPYQCTYCDKNYSGSTPLKKHIITHGIMPIKASRFNRQRIGVSMTTGNIMPC